MDVSGPIKIQTGSLDRSFGHGRSTTIARLKLTSAGAHATEICQGIGGVVVRRDAGLGKKNRYLTEGAGSFAFS